SELVGLRLDQLGMNQGVVRVVGKGDKERIVPMGEEAIHWLKRYLSESRPLLMNGRQSAMLFPNRRGDAMTRQAFWYRIKHYALRAGLPRLPSPHTLRHALDRKSTRLNSSHVKISYAVFCLKKKNKKTMNYA